ncbi:MAG: nucleoside deaminase [Gemmatimonadota bacterium]|nr:nucleoside deaminase [Gemmatimonadota bacterium]
MKDRYPSDERWMQVALDLAAEAGAEGETPVGALVVSADGVPIGAGRERVRRTYDPAAHAEVEAIRAACDATEGRHLSGATLYTTVEPCVLCAYAVRATRIARVVFGVGAGEVGSVDGLHPVLVDARFTGWGEPPEVVSGVLADACRERLEHR